MELVLPIGLSLLAILGAATGVWAALRTGGIGERARRSSGREEGLRRVSAQMHTGWEQTLLGLVRELGLPREQADLRYGDLYLETQHEQRLLVRSRSAIDRGFIGAVDLRPQRGVTAVEYAILRLPGDEDLHREVLDFELRLIGALRRIDQHVDVQLAADALRGFERRMHGGSPGAPRPADG